MNLTLKDIVNLTIKSLKIKQDDVNSIALIKNAINKAYIDLSNIDKRVSRAYIPIINGVATLPNNLNKIIKTNPKLTFLDYTVGNSIITDKTGVIEVLYSYTREPLIEDTDEPDLDITLQYALSTYACYKYFEHKKDILTANSFLNNYMQEIVSFNQDKDNSPETVIDIREVDDYDV